MYKNILFKKSDFLSVRFLSLTFMTYVCYLKILEIISTSSHLTIMSNSNRVVNVSCAVCDTIFLFYNNQKTSSIPQQQFLISRCPEEDNREVWIRLAGGYEVVEDIPEILQTSFVPGNLFFYYFSFLASSCALLLLSLSICLSIHLIFQRDSLKWSRKRLRSAISRDQKRWREIFYRQQEERGEIDQRIGGSRISGFRGSEALEGSVLKLGSCQRFRLALYRMQDTPRKLQFILANI